MRKNILLASLLILVIAISGCTNYGGKTNPPPTNQPPAETNAVSISGYAFNPAVLTVKAGTTIKWTNRDSITHTITSDGGVFDSGSISNGGSFSYTFNQPGTFEYHCTTHPSMKAKIIVEQ